MIIEPKINFCALAAANPVNLLVGNTAWVVNCLQTINQAIGIVGDAQHPLVEGFLFDNRIAALMTTVDHFFVSQTRFTKWAPVNINLCLICHIVFKELQKEPLRPFVVAWVSCTKTARPVNTRA